MSRYTILDPKKISNNFYDVLSPRDVLNSFISSFGLVLDKLHKGMMSMDKDKIFQGFDAVFGCFAYVTTPGMAELGHKMQEIYWKITSKSPKEKDWQDLAEAYIVYLEKCIILKRELEDYSEKPVTEPDLEGFIKETRAKFELQQIELKSENASCAQCSIF